VSSSPLSGLVPKASPDCEQKGNLNTVLGQLFNLGDTVADVADKLSAADCHN